MIHSNSCGDLVAGSKKVASPKPNQQQKIIDKLQSSRSKKDEIRFSFEYFPPKTQLAIENLTERVSRMALTQPLFIDITHSKNCDTLGLARKILKHTTLDVMPHLSMTDMTKYDLREYLNEAKEFGIRNLLLIRGDPPRGHDTWEPIEDDLVHTTDLIKFIRDEYNDYFCLAVGGYPEGHFQCESLEMDIHYLKQKIDNGADLIITQLFYDAEKFFQFVEECRKNGIQCPIIPGLLPIQTYSQFVQIMSFNNIYVAPKIWDDLDPIKEDDEKVKQYGVKLTELICQQLIEYGIQNLHFYTMNLESSIEQILLNLKLLTGNTSRDIFPWPCAQPKHRQLNESVRPIFWSNRTESYLKRTAHWDEYPNGRWGDRRSPAYGEFPEHHLLKTFSRMKLQRRRQMLGADLNAISDICNVFVNYLSGTISQLPWCTKPILSETLKFLLQPLIILNKNQFLTINSQPQINGASSTDPAVGWGRKGGVVYQKAYLEFFCNQNQLQILLMFMEKYPSLTYQAVNTHNIYKSNCSISDVNAVTWGVFPCCEIIQPTIVDPHSFLAWKDEAFGLWTQIWRIIYDQNSNGYKLISGIVDEWFLVNIVENNYINGNIFAPFVDYFRYVQSNQSNNKRQETDEHLLVQSVSASANFFQQQESKVADELFVKESKDENQTRNAKAAELNPNPYVDQVLLKSIAEEIHTATDGKSDLGQSSDLK